MKKAKWSHVLIGSYGWNVRYLIEIKRKSGKVPFGIYNVLTDKESVMQLLCVSKRQPQKCLCEITRECV